MIEVGEFYGELFHSYIQLQNEVRIGITEIPTVTKDETKEALK